MIPPVTASGDSSLGILSVAFNPAGTVVATGGGDNTLRQFSAHTGQSIGPTIAVEVSAHLGRPGPPTGARTVAYGPGGRTVVAVSNDGVQRFDATTGHRVGAVIPTALGLSAFSRDGSTVAVYPDGSTVRTYQVATGTPDGPPDEVGESDNLRPSGAARAMALSPNGKVVTTIDSAGTLRLIGGRTGRPLAAPLADEVGVFYSADGSLLAAEGDDGKIRVIDAVTGQSISVVNPDGPDIEVMSFSPDDRTLVVSDDSGNVQQFDATTGRAVSVPMAVPSHTGPATVVYSRDSRMLAVSSDGAVRLSRAPPAAPWARPSC